MLSTMYLSDFFLQILVKIKDYMPRKAQNCLWCWIADHVMLRFTLATLIHCREYQRITKCWNPGIIEIVWVIMGSSLALSQLWCWLANSRWETPSWASGTRTGTSSSWSTMTLSTSQRRERKSGWKKAKFYFFCRKPMEIGGR